MKKNVGTYDAFMRITCGLTGLAWGTARMIRRPNSSMPYLITMASAMKVAEGMTRFCPMLAMLGRDSTEMQEPVMSTIKKVASKATDIPNGVDEAIEEMAQDMTQRFARTQRYTRDEQ